MKHVLYPWLSSFLWLLAANGAFADELTVGFGIAKPPFVFAKSIHDIDQTQGIELDVMRQALAVKGHSFLPRYVSYNRLAYELKVERVDAVATVRPELASAHYSEEFIYFHNYAVTRSGSGSPIRDVSDLAGRRIVAWQGAAKDLGPAFEKVVKKASLYREIADQGRQVLLFLKGRVDVTVIDANIFSYWVKVHGESPKVFDYHAIFGGRTSFVVGFVSARIRDDFNEGLRAIKKSGAYEEIFCKYICE